MISPNTLEQPQELASEDDQSSVPTSVRSSHQLSGSDNPQPSLSLLPTAIKDTFASERRQSASSAPGHAHRDLTQIIARAREDIKHLREELSRHEIQIAHIRHERDDLEQRYTHLYDNFLEAVHAAAEEEVRQAAYTLRITPGRIPRLFEPIQESLTHWLEKQQAEREAALRQKLETVEQQAAIIRQELTREREALNAEREKFAQERQTFTAHMKTRETALQNRWLVKAWSTAAVMFLVLPALQVYLLTQNADTWTIIIIPTTTCLVLTALINLVRSRKKPPAKISSEKK